jgi:putative spermidine/putrescine transport system substrate-binding protein
LTGQTVVVYSFGGPVGEAFKRTIFEPFAEATGAEVVVDDTCCERLPAAADAGQFIGDVLYGLERGNLLGWSQPDVGYVTCHPELLEIQAAHAVPEELRSDCVMPSSLVANVIAGRDPEAPLPQNWAEFWDVERFPGPRGLTAEGPNPVMEIALMADGVPPDELYPLDIDRAFASLDRLRNSTEIFFASSGAEQVQYISSGETEYSQMFNTRVYSAALEGLELAYTFNQAPYQPPGGSVLKGARNVPGAIALLEYLLDHDVQAAQAEATGLSPLFPEATALLPPETQAQLPTAPENVDKLVRVSDEYWLENLTEVTARWEEWLASGG